MKMVPASRADARPAPHGNPQDAAWLLASEMIRAGWSGGPWTPAQNSADFTPAGTPVEPRSGADLHQAMEFSASSSPPPSDAGCTNPAPLNTCPGLCARKK